MQNSGVRRLYSNTGMRAWEAMLSFLKHQSISIMKKRVNKNAVCSSDNYRASKKLHIDMLKEKHNTFVPVEDSLDSVKGTNPLKLSVVMVSISIFGKKITITKDEYDEHCQGMKYQYV